MLHAWLRSFSGAASDLLQRPSWRRRWGRVLRISRTLTLQGKEMSDCTHIHTLKYLQSLFKQSVDTRSTIEADPTTFAAGAHLCRFIQSNSYTSN